LALICEARDRLEALGEAIARDGETYLSRGVPKANPALRDELATRSFIVKSLERLGITLEPIKAVGRPGRGLGITWEQLHGDNRTPIARVPRAAITAAAVEAYRQLRAWDNRCICPKLECTPGSGQVGDLRIG